MDLKDIRCQRALLSLRLACPLHLLVLLQLVFLDAENLADANALVGARHRRCIAG